MWMLVNFVLTAMAISSIAVTISTSKLFAPLVAKVQEYSKWLGQLVSCHYCLSHWIAMFAALFFPVELSNIWIVNWFVTAFALVTLSSVFSLIIIGGLILASTKSKMK